jgi:hypothetical protein
MDIACGVWWPSGCWPISAVPPPDRKEWAKFAKGLSQAQRRALGVRRHLEDQCRVRNPQSMRVVGMFRRFSNSLFMHWRSQQKRPQHKTTADFFSAMNAEPHRYAIRCLHARQPSFQTGS